MKQELMLTQEELNLLDVSITCPDEVFVSEEEFTRILFGCLRSFKEKNGDFSAENVAQFKEFYETIMESFFESKFNLFMFDMFFEGKLRAEVKDGEPAWGLATDIREEIERGEAAGEDMESILERLY